MSNSDSDLIFEAYINEAKEAPSGKHYDTAGRLRKGDADADGRGGPKYRSDPTYVNPNDEEVRSLKDFEIEAEDNILPVIGLGLAGGAAGAVGNHLTKKVLPKDEDAERCPVTGKLRKKSDEEDVPEEGWEKGTSKAPKGKSFDMSRGGAPSNVDAASDGSGGRYRKTRPPSAPRTDTHGKKRKNPEEDDLGLGPNTPSVGHFASIGSTTPFKKKTEAPIEDEMVYIQAGQPEDGHNHEDMHEFDYDGEIDMARAELLKATDYSQKLFDMVANNKALPGWVASKITKASDYLSSVFHYMDYEMNYGESECEEDKEIEIDDLDDKSTAVDTGFAGPSDEEKV